MRSLLKGKVFVLALIIMVGACSSGGLKERAELRTLLNQGKYAEGLQYVKDSDFYQDEDNRLLKNLEMGLIHHMAGHYYQSVKYLNKAKEIHKKLFTKSISKKAKTLIVNDNIDIYYGASYERSLIHFYLALNHYMLFQKGVYEAHTTPDGKKQMPAKKLTQDDIRREIMAARAEILDWDSYLQWIKNDKAGKSVFKNDMLAKVFGGLIHEAIGTRNDDGIALQLFRDAKKLLFRNYNAYKTFNGKAKKFKKDFKKLPKLKKVKVEREYVSKTNFQKGLEDYLNMKILTLTKKLKPNEYKKMIGIHKPSKDVLKWVKSQKKRSNVTVVLQRGFIPKKIPSTQYYSLERALTPKNPTKASKAIAKIGASIIMIFAANQLGMLPPPNNYSPVGMEIGVRVAAAAGNHLAISFELPVMENKEIKEQSVLAVYDKNGKKVLERPLPLVNPLIDIAREAIAEDSAARHGRIGFRLATKHLTAIAASFGTYSLMKEKTGSFLAKQAAVVQYMGASKAIAATESADTRYWSTLPEDFRIVDFYLPKGTYNVKVEVFKKKGDAKTHKRVVDYGTLTVKGKGKNVLNMRAI